MKKLVFALLVPVMALAIYDLKTVTLNNWTCTFYNCGTWGHNNGNPGGQWRGGSYIFGAGIWIGTIRNTWDTTVTVGYNPNSGGSEMVPTLCRYWREGYADSRDRIYMYPGDWPPPPDRFPMAPQTSRSELDLWTCCCDSDPAKHIPGPTPRPIGLDVLLTVYAFTDSLSADMFFMRYDVCNCTDSALTQTYFGQVIDADVGNASDDLCGLILNRLFQVGGDTIRVTNTGYCYSSDNIPSGAVATRLLKGPAGLGLTAFKIFTLTDADPKDDVEQYLALAGYDYWNPQRPYNPYDSIDNVPADKRYALACGPFTIQPESSVTFWYAIIGSPFDPADTSELAVRCAWAERVYERLTGIAERKPEPAAPRLTIGPSPFSPSRPLRVSVPTAGPLTLDVYDATGRLVRSLAASGQPSAVGFAAWDGSDSRGRLLPAGIYFVQATTSTSRATAKVLLARD